MHLGQGLRLVFWQIDEMFFRSRVVGKGRISVSVSSVFLKPWHLLRAPPRKGDVMLTVLSRKWLSSNTSWALSSDRSFRNGSGSNMREYLMVNELSTNPGELGGLLGNLSTFETRKASLSFTVVASAACCCLNSVKRLSIIDLYTWLSSALAL